MTPSERRTICGTILAIGLLTGIGEAQFRTHPAPQRSQSRSKPSTGLFGLIFDRNKQEPKTQTVSHNVGEARPSVVGPYPQTTETAAYRAKSVGRATASASDRVDSEIPSNTDSETVDSKRETATTSNPTVSAGSTYEVVREQLISERIYRRTATGELILLQERILREDGEVVMDAPSSQETGWQDSEQDSQIHYAAPISVPTATAEAAWREDGSPVVHNAIGTATTSDREEFESLEFPIHHTARGDSGSRTR